MERTFNRTNAILQNIPVASTVTGAFEIAVFRIHGKGRPTVTSKILLPKFKIRTKFFPCTYSRIYGWFFN